MPGWVTDAVSAHVRQRWSWMIAALVNVAPRGGPSWIRTPCSTPGRSGSASESASPVEAFDRNRVQPARPPTANDREAKTQPTADRPRTGVTVTSTMNAHSSVKRATDAHAACCIAQAIGRNVSATVASCHPDRPKNHPIRALE